MGEEPPRRAIAAQSWGDLAAARLHQDWLGRVWEQDERSLLLVDGLGEVVRLVVAEEGDGPLHVVLPPDTAAPWVGLPRGLYAWRVGRELWVGDSLTFCLPLTAPWPSRLRWEWDDGEAEPTALARHLALLADWLLARAPETTLAGLLPDLLAAPDPAGGVPDRADLPAAARLFRWRAGRAVGSLLLALATGDLAEAETSVNRVAGLGAGDPPAGDWFVLGLVAGLRGWPPFLHEGSGLLPHSLTQRLARSAAERTSLLGSALLRAALDDRWDARWHDLRAALLATDGRPDERRDHLLHLAALWLAHDESAASAALAGLVLPFLWTQRFLT